MIGGLRVFDSILPVGRGQRQLILGDRYTGKTSIFLRLLITPNMLNLSGSIDGFGTKRLSGPYTGMNQNPNKLSKILSARSGRFTSTSATHSPCSSLPSFMISLVGITIIERLRDRGFDRRIRLDDPPKHAKPYRQISLIPAKIPRRDALPADTPNIHSPSSERRGKLKYLYFGGPISASPAIETINPDTTEYIATNVIPITDGQFHINKRLSLDPCRPATDSSPPAPRSPPNASMKLMKIAVYGIKNE